MIFCYQKNYYLYKRTLKVYSKKIPFNKLNFTGRELEYFSLVHTNGQLSADGQFTANSHTWLEAHTDLRKALPTHSCTAALEETAILADIQPGDEGIMPCISKLR